jgi:hypothetical protein
MKFLDITEKQLVSGTKIACPRCGLPLEILTAVRTGEDDEKIRLYRENGSQINGFFTKKQLRDFDYKIVEEN